MIKRTRKYHPTRTSGKSTFGEVLHILMLDLTRPVKWVSKSRGQETLQGI